MSEWIRFARSGGDSRYLVGGVAPGACRLWIEPGAVVGGFDRNWGERVQVTDRDLEIDLVVPER